MDLYLFCITKEKLFCFKALTVVTRPLSWPLNPPMSYLHTDCTSKQRQTLYKHSKLCSTLSFNCVCKKIRHTAFSCIVLSSYCQPSDVFQSTLLVLFVLVLKRIPQNCKLLKQLASAVNKEPNISSTECSNLDRLNHTAKKNISFEFQNYCPKWEGIQTSRAFALNYLIRFF